MDNNNIMVSRKRKLLTLLKSAVSTPATNTETAPWFYLFLDMNVLLINKDEPA